MIIQNASADGRTDMTFTIGARGLCARARNRRAHAEEIGAAGVRHEEQVAKVSMVGVGMRTHAGVAATMFKVLAAEGINIEMISTSEIKVSVVVNSKYGELAMRALHDAFIEATATAARKRRPGLVNGGCKTHTDLRHYSARRLPVRGRFADGRGQAARLRSGWTIWASIISRADGRARTSATRRSFKEVKKIKIRHAKIAAFGSTRRSGMRAAADRNLQLMLRTGDAGRDRRRQDLGHARARGAQDFAARRISKSSTTRSRF